MPRRGSRKAKLAAKKGVKKRRAGIVKAGKARQRQRRSRGS